jgi:Protein of unknown function (DUF4031)
MTVWVDDAFIEASVPNGKVTHTSRWCHLVADDLEELHDYARALGLKRSYFQDHPRHPHYDVTEGKRRQAVRLGAVEIGWRETAALLPCLAEGKPAPGTDSAGITGTADRPAVRGTAEDLDRLAGDAWRSGEADRALALLSLGRLAFPAEAARWNIREARVRAAAARRNREATS